MNIWLQYIVVALLVIGALLFATWRLISANARVRLLDSWLRILPAGDDGSVSALRVAVLRWRTKVATAGGCSACAPAPRPAPSRRN